VFLAISLIEFHSRRITDPQDISQTLGLDLLGSLPAMPKPLIKFWEQPKESRMALWNNALIEAVDSTRSILLHDPNVEQRRVLMVASAAAQEGKTTFACQLAGSLARAGRKTVLVDFDLRRPRAHELLNVPLELGLSELLSEKLDVQTVLHSTSEPSLSVIPAGRVNESALQSIAKDGADWLFKELKKEFEFIIVDSSPILYVADSASVGRNVDGAIMVVRSHASRLPAVAVACERVEMLGIDLIGGVMVGVQSNLSGYGYSYDYHYGATSG
jgi:polysaccharide biosynthesis transport protein